MWFGRVARRGPGVLGIGIVAVLVASCAFGPSGLVDRTEVSLGKRVDTYWRAQQKGDVEALRALVDPDLREGLAETLERMGRPSSESRIVSWTIDRVEREGSKASVWVKVRSVLRHPLLGRQEQEVESEVASSWVWKNGQWYVVMEEPNLHKLLERYERSKKGL